MCEKHFLLHATSPRWCYIGKRVIDFFNKSQRRLVNENVQCVFYVFVCIIKCYYYYYFCIFCPNISLIIIYLCIVGFIWFVCNFSFIPSSPTFVVKLKCFNFISKRQPQITMVTIVQFPSGQCSWFYYWQPITKHINYTNKTTTTTDYRTWTE